MSGHTCLVINSENDLKFWHAFGGHALIIKELAESKLSEKLQPREVAKASGAIGFIDAESLPPQKRQHAPTKTVRMSVLTRDGRRCFICGRSPANHVDLELHVHHIVPWGEGGITEPENLVTLCGTCHGGLDPHFDWGLVTTVKSTHYPQKSDYMKQLLNYQMKVREIMKEMA